MRDRFVKPTQLGTVIVNLFDEALCENTASTVCQKCRYDLLCLEKMKEYEEVKSQLKTQLRENRASQQLQRQQVLRLRSPSAESTGVSPAAQRTYRSVSTARKELFPTVDPNPTDVTASVTPIACEQYARYSSSRFSKSLQDKTSTERQHLENQRLSVSSQYAHEDISSLESCLNCLRLDCLRTSMSTHLETVINSR